MDDDLRNALEGEDPLPKADAPETHEKEETFELSEKSKQQTIAGQETFPIETDDDSQKEVKYLVQKAIDVAEIVLKNYKDDREQIEEFINDLKAITAMGTGAPRVFIESLGTALRTKSETNASVVKLIDALAKLLSAGKGTQLFIGHNEINQPDLKKLLDIEPYPDEQ